MYVLVIDSVCAHAQERPRFCNDLLKLVFGYVSLNSCL